jgi:hypothetical protein
MNKKTLISRTVLAGSLLAAALLSSRGVEAGLRTHIVGTICKPSAKVDRSSISYANHSAANTNTSSKAVVCGLPMKYSIGKTLEYDINVVDMSTTDDIDCNVYALDSSNNVLWASPERHSGDGSYGFTGFASMTVTSTAFANEDATQRHYAVCTLPGAPNANSQSSVLGIRLY